MNPLHHSTPERDGQGGDHTEHRRHRDTKSLQCRLGTESHDAGPEQLPLRRLPLDAGADRVHATELRVMRENQIRQPHDEPAPPTAKSMAALHVTVRHGLFDEPPARQPQV